jgi:hypothetical protein
MLVRDWFLRVRSLIRPPPSSLIATCLDQAGALSTAALALAKAHSLIDVAWPTILATRCLGCLVTIAASMPANLPVNAHPRSLLGMGAQAVKLGLSIDLFLVASWWQSPHAFLSVLVHMVNLVLLFFLVSTGSIASLHVLSRHNYDSLVESFAQTHPMLTGALFSAWTLSSAHFVLGTYAIVAWENVVLILLCVVAPTFASYLSGTYSMPRTIAQAAKMALCANVVCFWLCAWIMLILYVMITLYSSDTAQFALVASSVVQIVVMGCMMAIVLCGSLALVVQKTARHQWEQDARTRALDVARVAERMNPKHAFQQGSWLLGSSVD